ncbi:MAG: hypothetical protein QNJ36_20955 [Calothrix sp. MO_167.B42]|nr:hypothetical protein [Calothrix sp. MO_167.B42]
MSKINYTAMMDKELKEYLLNHRDDKNALTVYLERRHQRANSVITTVDDPDFDAKIQAVIRQQMKDIS